MKKSGRNERCPCGSGKKQKQCCAPATGALLDRAIEHHVAGRLEEAEALYRDILALNPNHADALHLLGDLCRQWGNTELALDFVAMAIHAKPSEANYHYTYAMLLKAEHRLDEALASYRQALLLNPALAEAHSGLGNALLLQGHFDEAIACYRRALTLRPDYVDALFNLGNALKATDLPEEAIGCYRRALEIAPGFVEARHNLGALLAAHGKADEAIAYYRHELALNPDSADLYNALGSVFKTEGKLDDAIANYQQAIALNPYFGHAYNNLAVALVENNKEDEAIVRCRQAILVMPELPEAYSNLASSLGRQCRLDEALDNLRMALELRPDYPEAFNNLLLLLLYSPKHSAAEVFAEHRRYAERFEAPLKPGWPLHTNQRAPHKRLKIGYVSGDFRTHAVAFFMEPVLANHDKSQVEVFCYYNHHQSDAITQRLEAMAEHWLPCAALSDARLAECIRADGIDILVDLSGHTAHNRLPVFARKPAPLQVSWIGYPGTTGLDAMDYRITDQYMDPPGMTEWQHSEELLRLPVAVAYQPPDGCPPVNSLPALTSGQFTFACLNNLVKLNQVVVGLWARILLALPDARLMLGNVTSAIEPRLIGMFAQEGIPAERLVLLPRLTLGDYLALHHQIDLALDPFPYGGGTTSFHSLWMGVPVLTLAGDRSASRCGATILVRAELPQFIANSADEYVAKALRIARDLPALDAVRQATRAPKASDANNDALHLTRHLEAAYRNIWQTWCAQGQSGLAPESTLQ